MSGKLKLTRIELETKDGKKVGLSLEEARELYNQLNELFGSKYVPSAPVIIERGCYPWRDPYNPYWDVTCGTATDCQIAGASGLLVTYSGESVKQ